MPDRSPSSPDEPRWGPASTHHATPRRRPNAPRPRPQRAAVPLAEPEIDSHDTRFANPEPAPQPRERSAGGAYPWEPAGEPQGSLPPAPPPRPRRRHRKRWLILAPLLILALLVAYPITLGMTAMGSVDRVDALPQDSAGQGASGRNILVVGTDSRVGTQGMGKVENTRADTIMLLHVPLRGDSALVSIPRDSYVEIPGHGKNKVNAAYALGGPKLLTQTVEELSGIKIDDYVETGLGGFGKVVDAVGGVQICPKRNMVDDDADLDVKKGCQTANGATALGYARARHSDPEGDLGRVKRQREVLASIVKKAASPSTILNPFNSYPLAKSGGEALRVDDGTGWFGIARFLQGMRSVSGSSGINLTVPVSNPSVRTDHGLVVELDENRTNQLFTALREGDNAAVKELAK